MDLQEGLPSSKREKTNDLSSSLKPSYADAFSRDSSPIKEAWAHYFTTQPGIGPMEIWTTPWMFSENSPKAVVCWESPFMRYDHHGMGWSI